MHFVFSYCQFLYYRIKFRHQNTKHFVGNKYLLLSLYGLRLDVEVEMHFVVGFIV